MASINTQLQSVTAAVQEAYGYRSENPVNDILRKKIAISLGYNVTDFDGVAGEANIGEGCVNPLTIASLKQGDVVVDLGSGAGFDCFLASRKVGPTGRVIGFNMTQLLGVYCGAALVYVNYREAIDAMEGHGIRTHQTAVIFSTYPQDFLSNAGQFFSEFLTTTVLIMGILAMTSARNCYAMNIARDFAPRVFAYCAGYGSEVWSYSNYYWWVPVVAPLCGALAAGTLYDVFIFTGDSPKNKSWSDIRPALGILWMSRRAERLPQV